MDDKLIPTEPLTDEEVAHKVRQIVAQALDCQSETLREDANLYREYGLDSLGAVFVFVELNVAFGVPEPSNEGDYAALSTIEKLVNFVKNFVKAQSGLAAKLEDGSQGTNSGNRSLQSAGTKLAPNVAGST